VGELSNTAENPSHVLREIRTKYATLSTPVCFFLSCSGSCQRLKLAGFTKTDVRAQHI